MGSLADFHTHSTVSDGRLTPSELVGLAYRNGVRIMSLTDHDIVDGLPEAFNAAARYADFTLVPGIEMSTDVEGGEVHILGHFIDWQDNAFRRRLSELQESRLGRARKMTERLRELGRPVEWERVESFAGEGAVGRPHIALALVEAGHVATVNEAFDRFLSRTGPAYVGREKLTPQQVIEIISGVGGFATLAHPREFGAPEGFLPLLEELARDGLTGMEVYYQDYAPEDVESLRRIADSLGLIPLGGSDYHGLGGPRQREPGDIPLIMEPVERLLDLAKGRGVLQRAKGPAALR